MIASRSAVPDPPARRRRRLVAPLIALTVISGLLACTEQHPAAARPTTAVTTVVSGLSIPWDLTWVGSTMLFTVRAGRVYSKVGSASPTAVSIPLDPTFAESEGGLLGIVADPQAATNKRFYTCAATATATGAARDLRVRRWRLTSNTVAVSDGGPVVTGLPLTSGRHSGCRLRFGADGKLYVGTGDAAVGTNPQDKSSLGGKVLRVNSDGTIPADNPFAAAGGNARYVWTYGHRNVQGLALRPGTSELWSVEHGTSRDDEVNLIMKGANYGWDPIPGYDESTPMTDLTKFPNAKPAKWSSGSPTVATSGATFLSGASWGSWQGALAVGLLKGKAIKIMILNPAGTVVDVQTVAGLSAYGRIRTVQQGPDGALYFTTSNGSGDKIGKITPQSSLPAYSAGQDVSKVGVSAVRSGTELSVFVRTTGGAISFRRSTDDGRTWPTSWRPAGVSSTSAPSVTSSAAGRVDLFTRDGSNRAIHTWYVNGVKQGSTNLGGIVDAAPAASSLGDGTMDVFVRSHNVAYRKHYDGTRWTAVWTNIGGIFSSTLNASADLSTRQTTVVGRGQTGGWIHQRVVTPTSNGTGWQRVGALVSWSARGVGDVYPGRAKVGVFLGSDKSATVDRGALVTAIPGVTYDSAPDVVTRPDGTWMILGRQPGGGLIAYDARPGGYAPINLGGIIL